MPGRKSDIKDSQWIAHLLYNKMLRPSFVPDYQRDILEMTYEEFLMVERRISKLVAMACEVILTKNIGADSIGGITHKELLLQLKIQTINNPKRV